MLRVSAFARSRESKPASLFDEMPDLLRYFYRDSMNTDHRKFTIRDGMIFIAGMAIGIAWTSVAC